MTVSSQFHEMITQHNILTKPTQDLASYFARNPQMLKAAMICNHIFRAAVMLGFMVALPFSLPVSAALCAAGALFYRLTAETNCSYKFSLPAFGGALSALIAKPALLQIISGVAFVSMSALATALIGIVPIAMYAIYVVLTVDYDVNSRNSSFSIQLPRVQVTVNTTQ